MDRISRLLEKCTGFPTLRQVALNRLVSEYGVFSVCIRSFGSLLQVCFMVLKISIHHATDERGTTCISVQCISVTFLFEFSGLWRLSVMKSKGTSKSRRMNCTRH